MTILSLLLLLPTALAAWPMEGRDAGRSGTTAAPLPTRDVALAWSAEGQFSGVLVAPDGSIVATGDPVAVFEPDGTVRWSTREVGEDKRVYRARGAGALLSDGTIVTAGHAGLTGGVMIVAFDPADGSQPWILRDQGRLCDSTDDTHIAVATDDSFYIGNCGPGILAFTKDGAPKWNVTASSGRVALGGGNVYAAVRDVEGADGAPIERAIAAFSQADGSLVWAQPVEGSRVDPIVGPDGRIYFVEDRNVVALAPADGARVWDVPAQRPFALGIAPNGTIAAAGSSVMTWLAPADGALLGTSPTKDGTKLLLGNGVHLRSYANFLRAVDASGATLWEVTGATREFQSNLAVGDDGSIYVAEDGKLHAYRGAGGTSAPATPSAPAPTLDDLPPAQTPADAPGDNGAPAPGLALLLLALVPLALLGRRRA